MSWHQLSMIYLCVSTRKRTSLLRQNATYPQKSSIALNTNHFNFTYFYLGFIYTSNFSARFWTAFLRFINSPLPPWKTILNLNFRVQCVSRKQGKLTYSQNAVRNRSCKRAIGWKGFNWSFAKCKFECWNWINLLSAKSFLDRSDFPELRCRKYFFQQL